MSDPAAGQRLAQVSRVTSVERLRELYGLPAEQVKAIETRGLDSYTREFIQLSPLVMVGTVGDVSSKGDEPGFVQIIDDTTLMIPDRAGNNRLDTLVNILDNSTVGLLFMIPGVGEVLRVNGTAEITDDPIALEPMSMRGKMPKTGIIVHIDTVFYTCARSLLRSKVWDPSTHLDRRAVPSPAMVSAGRRNEDAAEYTKGYKAHISDLYDNQH